jgi:hypothetical protein
MLLSAIPHSQQSVPQQANCWETGLQRPRDPGILILRSDRPLKICPELKYGSKYISEAVKDGNI